MTPTNILIFSAVLLFLGIIGLFYAENDWAKGQHERALILASIALVPLAWTIWLRLKRPRGGR